MSLRQDHHGIVAEVFSPQGSAFSALATVIILFVFALGAWLSITEDAALGGLFFLLPVVAMALATLVTLLRLLGRVVVRLTDEYLVVEKTGPLRAREVTRAALSCIRSVRLRHIQSQLMLVVEADGLGTIEIPCQSQRVAEQLCEKIRQATEVAPGFELRKTERPPESLDRLRKAERAREKV